MRKCQLILLNCLLLLPIPVVATSLSGKELPLLTWERNHRSQPPQLLAQNLSPSALQVRAQQITVRVSSNNERGSGVLIGKQQQTYLVLTNAHVILGSHQFQIQTADGQIHPATLVSSVTFKEDDLALLEFHSPQQYQLATFAPQLPQPGTPVLAAGYSVESGQSQTAAGKITQILSPALQQGYEIGYSSDIVSGMSGGPILNQAGQVIGLNGRSAYPILNNGYVYANGARPSPEQIQLLRRSSWGIGIGTALAQMPPTLTTAFGLPQVNSAKVAVQPSQSNQWLGQLEEKTRQITVRIDNKDTQEAGSGIIIAHQNQTYYVLTCNHVLKGEAHYVITTPDGKQYAVTYAQVQRQPGVDLAVVPFTSSQTYQVATLADAPTVDNQYMFVGGYAKPQQHPSEWRFSPGKTYSQEHGLFNLTIADEVDASSADHVEASSSATTASLRSNSSALAGGYGLVYTNNTAGGMSGGPVLDTQGRVIGIHGEAEIENVEGKTEPIAQITLGYSLGIPVKSFLGIANHLGLEQQSLQVQHSAAPPLDSQQQTALQAAVLRVAVPAGTAQASDWIERGSQLWRLGRNQEALAAFDQAVKMHSDFAYLAWYGRTLVLGKQKKYQEMVSACAQAIRNRPSFYPAYEEQSVVLAKLHQLKPALAAIEAAIRLQPNDPNLYNQKSLVLEQLKEYPAALVAITQAIQLRPMAAFYSNRGSIYGNQKQWNLALQDANRALQLDPNYAEAYNNRGNVYADQKRVDLALQDYNHALQLDPNLAQAYLNLGNIYDDQKRVDLALQDYNHALQLDPNYAQAYNNRGVVYDEQKRVDLALQDYNRAIQLDPNYVTPYVNRGGVYREQKRVDLALQDFNRAIQLDPNYAQAYNNRGVVYHDQNKVDLALQDFNRAIQLDPNYAQAYNNRGLMYSEQKRVDLALQDANRAIQLAPNDAEAHKFRELVYQEQRIINGSNQFLPF